MRTRFDMQLEDLSNHLIQMGALTERAIASAVTAIIEKDAQMAADAISYEQAIDESEAEIERLCLKLLMQQQPVAKDLRLISAVLKMITDMERIGDHASDISEISLVIKSPGEEHLPGLREMAEATIKMVADAIDAFVKNDLELARKVIADDDVVDNYFLDMRALLVEMIQKGSVDGEVLIDLLMVIKYLERIGDHATNLAEWVVFSITGLHKGEEV